MVFSSLTFLCLFLPAVLLLHTIFHNIHVRNGILLVFSLLFYAWGEPVWVLGMVFTTAVNWLAAVWVTRTRRRWLRRLAIALAAAVSLSFLVYFKYAAFFANSAAALFGVSLGMVPPTLPIGISFYTFQAITYSVDVYRGRAPAQKNPLLVLLYISFFPQLIAGPIVQYGDIANALRQRSPSVRDYYEGFSRFIVGLAKKVLLANLCGEALTMLPAAGGAQAQSVAGAWVFILLFAFQIYFDFSGYSDMAIGMGQVFGFRFLENFNYPYASSGISEFWRRWHMSLGAFFRDYVYIPLGGNRVPKPRLVLNLLVVWGLTGLWHGASWNFVAWGLYYGVLIILERLVPQRIQRAVPRPLRHLLTLILVLFGWVLFYYESLPHALAHLGAMLGIGADGLLGPAALYALKNNAVLLAAAALASLPLVPAYKALVQKQRIPAAATRAVLCARPFLLSALLLLTFSFLVGQSFNPFLYFRF